MSKSFPETQPEKATDDEQASHDLVHGTVAGGEFIEFSALKGSIGRKLVVSLALMFVLFILINEAVHQLIIKPTFTIRDQADAVDDVTRVLAALNQEIDSLDDMLQVLKWASASGPPINQLDGIGYPDDNTFVLDTGRLKTGSEEKDALPFTEHLILTPDERGCLLDVVGECVRNGHSSCRGVLKIGPGTALIVVVAPSAKEGHFLVLGRPLNQRTVGRLASLAGVDFCVRVADGLSCCAPTTSIDQESKKIVVQTQLLGLDGQPTLDVTLDVPQRHVIDSAQTFAVARRSFVLCSIAALLFLLLLLGRLVVRPLSLLRSQIRAIGEDSADVEHLRFEPDDEIADLARSFDEMMTRLSTAQEQLAEAALVSGRSQVATTVIHNVGNVLTNVNSLVDTARGRIGKLQVGSLHRLADRLERSTGDAELLAATPKYLHGLAHKWEQDQAELSKLLVTLEDNLRHIHDVIRDQQQHASAGLRIETIDLCRLIDEAIGCCQARLDADCVSVFVCDAMTDGTPHEVHVDRSLTLQVMINVITNARQAMQCQSAEDRQLQVSIVPKNGFIEAQFRDAGSGMDAETIQRAFDAHFTTREMGSGLGLHFCAISLKRFGGSIRVASEGLGTGCTVTLAFPCPQACIAGGHASSVFLQSNSSVSMNEVGAL